MASAVARAYNGGLGAPPPAGSRGRAPGQVVWGAKPPRIWKLFWFWTSHRAAFLQCSLGFLLTNVWHYPIFKLHGNQQKIGASEGNEKGQERDKMGNQDGRLTGTYSPWQAQLRLSYKLQFNSPDISLQWPIGFYTTTLSLSTLDDTNKITLIYDLLQKGYHEQYVPKF